MTYGIRRCGEPTPEGQKRPCPECKGTGKQPLGTGWDGFPDMRCVACDGVGKVNLNKTPEQLEAEKG